MTKIILPFIVCILFTTAMQSQTPETPARLKHVVLFKFKDDATPSNIKKVEDAFRALPGKINTVKDFEWGINNSPEGLNQGFTHCFLVTFDDDKGRQTYLVHPDHLAFVEVLKPYLDKALVIDYLAK